MPGRAEKALAKAGEGATAEPTAAAAPSPAAASGRASVSSQCTGSASSAGKAAKVTPSASSNATGLHVDPLYPIFGDRLLPYWLKANTFAVPRAAR